MNQHDRIAEPLVNGRISVCRIWHKKQDRRRGFHDVEPLFSKPNQIQYSWGFIAAQCIGKGNRNYRINSMYVEYENVASPGDAVTIPSYGRDEGREYYQDLALSANRDFLRVPLIIEPTIGIESGFEDYFTDGVDGNKLTFFTQTQGTAGFHSKPFNDGVNSKIFGVALVATPEFGDPTKDVVFSRTYFDTADQTLKLASSQVGITWDISFE